MRTSVIRSVSQRFELPDSFLRQLEEFSSGGFILIKMGSDGNPEVYMNFDNAITAIGLVRYAKMWSTALDDSNQKNITDSISEQQNGEEGET